MRSIILLILLSFLNAFAYESKIDSSRVMRLKIDSLQMKSMFSNNRLWTGSDLNQTAANDSAFTLSIFSTSIWKKVLVIFKTAKDDLILVGNNVVRVGGLVHTDSLRVGKTSTLDTTYTRALKFTKADSGYFIAGVKAPRFYGDLVGTADSAKGSHHLSGGSVDATTGIFSGLLSALGNINTDSIRARVSNFDSVYINRIKGQPLFTDSAIYSKGIVLLGRLNALNATQIDFGKMAYFYGDGSINPTLSLQNQAGTNIGRITMGNGGNGRDLYMGMVSGNAQVYLMTKNLPRITIDSLGSIGIGKTPTAKLDVNGHALTSSLKTDACTTGVLIKTGSFAQLKSTASGDITIITGGVPPTLVTVFSSEVHSGFCNTILASDSLIVSRAGKYRISYSLAVKANTASTVLYVWVYDNALANIHRMTVSMPDVALYYTISANFIASLSANTSLGLTMKTDRPTNVVTTIENGAVFNIEYLGE